MENVLFACVVLCCVLLSFPAELTLKSLFPPFFAGQYLWSAYAESLRTWCALITDKKGKKWCLVSAVNQQLWLVCLTRSQCIILCVTVPHWLTCRFFLVGERVCVTLFLSVRHSINTHKLEWKGFVDVLGEKNPGSTCVTRFSQLLLCLLCPEGLLTLWCLLRTRRRKKFYLSFLPSEGRL